MKKTLFLFILTTTPLFAQAECYTSWVYENTRYVGCDLTRDGIKTRFAAGDLSEEACRTQCYSRFPDAEEGGSNIYYNHGAF